MSVMTSEQYPAALRDGAGLTLLDLLREERFRLDLVAGEDTDLERPVAGAHRVEAASAGAALDPDWIVLTAGTRLPEAPKAQRRLVDELSDAGIAALGVCLGGDVDEVPETMVAEADRRGLPVFAVPRATPAGEIIAFVQRSLVSEEALAFGRMAALQRYLMDALAQPEPRATLVSRLADFLDAKAGVLEPSGRFAVATSDDLPAGEIRACVEGRRLVTVPFETTDWHGHAFALGDPEGASVSWLVVAVSSRRRPHPLAKAAGAATVPLLGAIDRMDEVQRQRDSAAREAALEALLDAESAQAARVAAAQLSLWGVGLGDGVAMVALDGGPSGVSQPQLLEYVRSRACCLDRPMLCAPRDGHVVVLLPAPVGDDVVTELVSGAGAGLRVGVGRVVTEPLDVRRSCSEAALAMGAAPGGPIGRYDDLDLGTLVLQELQLERLAPKIDAWLEPLRETPRVFETLVAYFDNNLDVGRTAEALHLHPNSVRYRLARAEELIGTPVRSPSTMIALHVAMAAQGQRPTQS
jgi:PucR family transcriptional regulator, purine catabolism regulatory protein